MSEETLENEGLEVQDEVQEVSEEIVEEDNDSQEVTEKRVSRSAQKAQSTARSNGWTSKDEWTSDGRDPEDWVSAHKFNERGKMIGSILDLKRQMDAKEHEFDERLNNQRMFLEAQQKTAIEGLQKQRKEAIEVADVDSADSIQNQIDSINQQFIAPPPPAAAEVPDSNMINDFNSSNPWIMQDSAKSNWMKGQFTKYFQSGMDTKSAISAAMQDISRDFPDVNPRRTEAATVEGSRSRPGKKTERSITWQDLTHEEMRVYKSMGGKSAFKSQDQFLQVVKDSRAS